jgi:signal transduction histidine kinase
MALDDHGNDIGAAHPPTLASRLLGSIRKHSSTLPTAEKAAALARCIVLITVFFMLETEVAAGLRALSTADLLVAIGFLYVVLGTSLELSKRVPRRLRLPMLVADVLLITGIIHLAGGIESEYYPLYYLPILQASVRLNFRDAVSTAILASAMYAVLGCATGFSTSIPTTAYLRVSTFGGSAIFMAAFFALLMRETRQHRSKSKRMGRLLDEVRTKNQELEEKGRLLTDAQDRLVASQKLALLGQLAGSVAHELRNPLGGIKNAAYALTKRMENGDETVSTLLNVIDLEVGNSDRIISSLLSFCRSEQIEPQDTDVNACACEALRKAHGHEDVTVTTELHEDLPHILGDESQLKLVLSNLVANAVEAMPHGGHLHVHTGVDNGSVWVEVRDTGMGIADDTREKIFRPLFTTKAKGVGLGLVICKTLVERNGGRIAISSTPGKGTSFIVKLPVRPDEGDADGQPAERTDN